MGKTDRGQLAFSNLKAFEGIPSPYDKVRRALMPSCYREIKLKPNRKYPQLAVSPPRPAGSTRTLLPHLRPSARLRPRCTGRTSRRRRLSRTRLSPMSPARLPPLTRNWPSLAIEQLEHCFNGNIFNKFDSG